MRNERLYKVLIGPYTTEKTVQAAENNRHIAFKVARDATKKQVAEAVKTLFDVKVKAVQILNVKGKTKRFKQRLGRQANWKKAYVALEEGFDINLANFE